MKPTIRVSIGGLAFTLEEDAYHVLNNYLKTLKRHFKDNTEADEIIADIEARLSELLQIKIKTQDGIVSITEAQEIINTMGNPKDFDDTINTTNPEENIENISEKEKAENEDSQNHYKKKLYRDLDNKIVGGVCSGLGHYFKVDPTAIRISVIGVLFLFNLLSFKGVATMLLVYAVLWAVMPIAKTFTQKLSMTGSDPSIENIENRTQTNSRKYKGSSVGSFAGIMIKVFVVIIAIVTLITMLGIIVPIIWLYFDTEILGLNNYLLMLGINTINFKTATILVPIIPIVGLFCLLIKILRRTPFTSRTLLSFITGLVFWLGALFYLGNIGVKFTHSHRNSQTATDNIGLNTVSDTLFVKLGDEYLNRQTLPNNPGFLYRGEKEKNRQIFILPCIKVEEDTTLTNFKIDISKNGFGNNTTTAKKNAEALTLEYNLSDSSLTINPKWYDKNNAWNLETYEVVIRTPSNKKVIVETPLEESYRLNHMKINGYDYLRHHFVFNFD